MRATMLLRPQHGIATATTVRNRAQRTIWHVAVLLSVLLCLVAFSASRPTQAHAQQRALSRSAAAVAANNPAAVGDVLPAGAPQISGTAAILLDPATEHVYLSMHAGQRLAMASTTKIMTTVVALTYGNPDQKITVDRDAQDMNNGDNSSANLKTGDVLTLRQLLYGLLLPSGDDAAVAIADGVAGSQAKFVTLMNAEAALLGLTHTHYVNPHGLDESGHYTTAGDLAQLARFALSFPLFRQIVATPELVVAATSEHPGYDWISTNTLLAAHYPGIIGIKTGHTGDAGYCLVFAAQRSYGELLGVVLGDGPDPERFNNATALLDWAFAQEKRANAWKTVIFGK
jgi:serine-type D-Ala-D-Ala carboxypeptidase (penicillin-binding protein 5/6)